LANISHVLPVGDWTSGSSSYPRKYSLTLLQGSNERRVSVPEGDEGSLRSTSLKTKTFGDHLRVGEGNKPPLGSKRSKSKTFGDHHRETKVTNGYPEA